MEGLRQQQRESKRKTDAALADVATARAELTSARSRLQQLQQVPRASDAQMLSGDCQLLMINAKKPASIVAYFCNSAIGLSEDSSNSRYHSTHHRLAFSSGWFAGRDRVAGQALSLVSLQRA